MEQLKLYDWLIVVFLHEIQTDLNYSNAMLNSIKKAGTGNNNAVFLIKDSVSTDEETRNFIFTLTVSQLAKDATGEWAFCPIEPPQLKINNKKKNCWETAFRYIYSHYTGQRNMLITYSEGAAFAINVQQGTVVQPAPAAAAPMGFIDLPLAKPGVGSVNGIRPSGTKVRTNQYYILDEDEMNDLSANPDLKSDEVRQQGDVWLIKRDPNKAICKSLELLWVSQLASALNRYVYGQYIDVLLMTNCFTQLFDNGYTLSNSVKFLIGAEGSLSMEGYDYGALMNTLNTTPAIPSQTLVRQVLTELKQLYNSIGADYTALTATVYANRLKLYPLALRVFEDLLEALTPLLPQIAGKLEKIRGQMANVTGLPNYPLVDAGLFVRLVTEQVEELEGAANYLNLFSELQTKIAVGNLVSDLVRQQDQQANPQFGYTGISLYFPADNQMHADQQIAWCAYFDSAIPGPFRTHSKWNVFLDKYFKALSRSQQMPPQAPLQASSQAPPQVPV